MIQKVCDVCGFMRQGRIKRYALTAQGIDEGRLRPNGRPGYRRGYYGGIDLCDECWERIGKPKMRPELRGRTGPNRCAG